MPIIKTNGCYIYKKVSKNTGSKKVRFIFLLFFIVSDFYCPKIEINNN